MVSPPPSEPPGTSRSLSPTESPTPESSAKPDSAVNTEPCSTDVCTDICVLACTTNGGKERFGTYVQEYQGLTVQCCASDGREFKDQCMKQEDFKIGKYRYDGEKFGAADVDVLCCLGKRSCMDSTLSIPKTRQVCCEGSIDMCRKAEFVSTANTSQPATITCRGKKACMKSEWERGGQANLCCSGEQTCEKLSVGDNGGISTLFSGVE